MVKQPGPDENDRATYFERLEERWPDERPSRRRAKRNYRRKAARRVAIEAKQRATPDVGRMSHALLTAQRELAQAQADADARRQSREGAPGRDDT